MSNESCNMSERGIKGNTGLGVNGMFHVSAPYDCNGKVFIRILDPEWGEVWRREDPATANPDKVIRCVMCDKPAVSLDHLWPYHSEMTRCDDHLHIKYREELDKSFVMEENE